MPFDPLKIVVEAIGKPDMEDFLAQLRRVTAASADATEALSRTGKMMASLGAVAEKTHIDENMRITVNYRLPLSLTEGRFEEETPEPTFAEQLSEQLEEW